MDNKFDELKNEYVNIKVDPEFRKRINGTMRKELIRMKMKNFAVGTAACLAVFAVTLNVSQPIAYAMSEIPVVNSIVKVLTFNRYEVNEEGMEAKVNIPKIEGLLDKELEDKLNEEFKENGEAVIAAFESSAKSLKEEFGEGNFHEGMGYDYQVKTDNDKILALDTYVYSLVGSSSTIHNFYNIDKATGELLTLKGLFKDGADYVTPISEYIVKECERLNTEENGMFWLKGDEAVGDEGFEKIAEDQNFYINENDQIVVCFDKYEIAAGAQGSPEFVIPNEVVADIIK